MSCIHLFSLNARKIECNGRVVTLLLRIWEAPGSNLVTETGYYEVLVVFLSPSRQMP
jgi:hypothetical protein